MANNGDGSSMEERKQSMFIIDSPDELRATESFSSVDNDVRQQILADSKD